MTPAEQHTFTCPVAHGLHARPASVLVEVTGRFSADITLTNERTGRRVNAKSILAVVSADVRLNDTCRIDAAGPDAVDAIGAVRDFSIAVLPTLQDEPPDAQPAAAPVLSQSFLELNASWSTATPVSPGIGRGIVVHMARPSFPEVIAAAPPAPPGEQVERLRAALDRVRAKLESERADAVQSTRRDILSAHLAIADDSELRAGMDQHIRAGCSAEQAVANAVRPILDSLRAADNAYIRERAADVEDIGFQLLEQLCGRSRSDATIDLAGPSVIVADDLTPHQLLAADRGLLRGLILGSTGATAHVVLMARSMGIPALTNLPGARARLVPGEDLLVDAHRGIIVRHPQASAVGYFARESEKHRLRRDRLIERARPDAVTTDGVAVKVAVNVSFAEDLNPESLAVSDGIGLLRTELAFADHGRAPTEDEQLGLYVRAVQSAGGKPAVIRLFDVGADKPLAFFRSPVEGNPALGCRGVRNYVRNSGVIRAQLRALVRASAAGPVRVMVPMVSCLDEVLNIREQITAIQSEFRTAGIPFDPKMPIGIMVEVPLIAHALDDVSPHVDFLSIGTNDLAQYFAAADRCNPAVSALANVRHPAFLRVLHCIAEAAQRHHCRISVCGDMAGDLRNLPLLLGLGIEELSVVASDLASIKAAVSTLAAADCRVLLEAALSCATALEVEALLMERGVGRRTAELFTPELVDINVGCDTRAEVIKHLVDALFISGRTDRPELVEAAVWKREQESTTGLGHGFAMPHCKCSAVGASSVAIARLKTPVEWESVDGAPVRCVILLAMREHDEDRAHMRVFSTLARRLMHDGFREGLLAAPDAPSLHALLEENMAEPHQEA